MTDVGYGIGNALKHMVSNCRVNGIEPSDANQLHEILDLDKGDSVTASMRPARGQVNPTWRLIPHPQDPPFDTKVIRFWDRTNAKKFANTIDFEYYNIPLETRQNWIPWWQACVHPRPEILAHVEREYQRLLEAQVTCAIHFRSWNPAGHSGFGQPSRETIQSYKDVDNLISDCESNILLCSDHHVSTAPNCLMPQRSNELRSLQNDFAEMLLLSKFKKLVLTRSSTFSECCWWLGGADAKIIALVGAIGDTLYGSFETPENEHLVLGS